MEWKKTVIDAVPHDVSVNSNANVWNENTNILLHKIFEDFTEEEYKSIFFLLMDFVGLDKFLEITKQEKTILLQKFYEYYSRFNDDKILIELLGTLKMYKKLRLLHTCSHVYKNQADEFNQIDAFW